MDESSHESDALPTRPQGEFAPLKSADTRNFSENEIAACNKLQEFSRTVQELVQEKIKDLPELTNKEKLALLQDEISKLPEVTRNKVANAVNMMDRAMQMTTDSNTRAYFERETLKLIQDEIDSAAAGVYDPNTGAHLKGPFFDMYAKFQDIINYSQGAEDLVINEERTKALLEKFPHLEAVMLVKDFNNFRAGNDILGHAGFDEFIKASFQGHIICSVEVSRANGYNDSEYAALSDQQLEASKKYKEKYFGDERGQAILEKMKEHGIVFDAYRQKAGADEAMAFVTFLKGRTEESEAVVTEYLKYMWDKSEIGTHGEQKINAIVDQFYTLPATIAEKLPVAESAEQQAELVYLTRFAELLSQASASENTGGFDFAKSVRTSPLPEIALIMDASYVASSDIGIIEDFFAGVEDHAPDKAQKLFEQADEFANRIANRISKRAFTSEEDRSKFIRKAISQEVFGAFFEQSNDTLDNVLKKADKIYNVIDAFTPMIKNGNLVSRDRDVYKVGALVAGGRLISDIDPGTAVAILKEISNTWTILALATTVNGERTEVAENFTDAQIAFLSRVVELRKELDSTRNRISQI